MKRILILILVLSMIAMTGCTGRTAITVEEFSEKMKEQGLTIIDATNQFEEGAVESVTIAMTDIYQIEFYVVSSEDQAISAFEENKEYFESVISNSSSNASVSMGNYSEYSRTTDDAYFAISRVGNTFVYIEVPKENKEAVIDLLDLLGY